MTNAKKWIPALVVSLAVPLSSSALAAEKSWWEADWVFRAGVVRIDPRSSSLTLASGERVVVDADSDVYFEAAVKVSERWGLELFVAPDPTHPMRLRGTTGLSDFGGTEQMLEIVSMQYHFNPSGRFRPYVGAGLAYAEYDDFSPAGIDLDRSFGPALQTGVDIGLNPRWFLNFSARWADVDTDVTLSGSRLGSAHIDPMIYSASIGFRLGEPAWTRRASATSSAAPTAFEFVKSAPPPPPPPAVARARVVESVVVGVDVDGDGVENAEDRCPATLRGLRVDSRGCE